VRMQQPSILQPAEADSTSIGRRRFTELLLLPLPGLGWILLERRVLDPAAQLGLAWGRLLG
jgi:hypothetical protein